MAGVTDRLSPIRKEVRRERELGWVEQVQTQPKSKEAVLLELAKYQDSEVKKVLSDRPMFIREEEGPVGRGRMLWVWMGVFVVALVVGLGGWFFWSRRGDELQRVNSRPGDKVNSGDEVAGVRGSGESLAAYRLDWGKLKGLEGQSLVRLENRMVEELRESYREIQEGEGCVGSCRAFIEDLDLVDENVALLAKMADRPGCMLTEREKDEFEEKFTLLAGGIESKQVIEGISLPGLSACGVRYLARDGYDLSLMIHMYKVVALDGDQVVWLELPVFIEGVLEPVDGLYEELGYGADGCDGECQQKEMEYLMEMEWESGVVAEVMGEYDRLVRTLERVEKE